VRIILTSSKSSMHDNNSKIAEDEDYTLFSVVTFKRVSEEFKHKLRDEKYVPAIL
jgi:hypothetical protein